MREVALPREVANERQLQNFIRVRQYVVTPLTVQSKVRKRFFTFWFQLLLPSVGKKRKLQVCYSKGSGFTV